MSVLLVLVMCLAVQAASCPNQCSCHEVVTCRGNIQELSQLPLSTTSLIIQPAVDGRPPPDITALVNTLADLPGVKHLALQGCAIQDIYNLTYDGFERLQTLDLSRNLITELSEEMSFNQTELRALDLSQNLIRVIHSSPFRTMCSLEVLNLSTNAIDSISIDTFCGLRSLITLDMSENNLTVVQEEMFASLMTLQQLNLSKNQLETLSETCFNSLQRLQQLDISWNKLNHMAPGTLQALPSLSRLMIAGNSALGGGHKDAALLVGTGRRLQTLDASRTGLEHVPAALTHSVRTLRLSANSIRTVQCGDLDSYPLLQLLDLTNNFLEEMEEDALGRLEMLVVLYLTDNKLHAIPRSLPDQLKILHLEFNCIEQIVSGDLLGLLKLEVLLLNDNNIKVVQEGAFSQMTSLITLDLSRNPISILPAGTLSGPSRLQVLRLSSLTVDPPAEDMTFPVQSPEHLVRLDLSNSPGLARQLLADKAALVAFRELQELNLTNSDLINIRSDLLHFLPQLRDLHITGNRLNCSGLLWLALWMRVQDQPEHRQVICVSPPELYGTLVVDLQDTDMDTTTENIITTTTTEETQTTSVMPDTTTDTINDINEELKNIFENNDDNELKPAIVNQLYNTNKSFSSYSKAIVKLARVYMTESTATVTAMSENRSRLPDAGIDLVHLFPMELEATTSVPTHVSEGTLTDGHILDTNLSNSPRSTQPSNYKVDVLRNDESQLNVMQSTVSSGTSERTASTTAASLDNNHVTKEQEHNVGAHYANKPTDSSRNELDEIPRGLFMGSQRLHNTNSSTSYSSDVTPPTITNDSVVSRPAEVETSNVTSGAATGEMSMYSSSREGADNHRAGLIHPGLLVLLATVVGAGVALSTLISHIRKRRKRDAANSGYYCRQQDIEVNSLPALSELW